MRVHGWTEGEIQTLIQNYRRKTNKELCRILNRSISAIRTRVVHMRLDKSSQFT